MDMSSLLVELPPIKEGRIFHKIKKRCICGKAGNNRICNPLQVTDIFFVVLQEQPEVVFITGRLEPPPEQGRIAARDISDVCASFDSKLLLSLLQAPGEPCLARSVPQVQVRNVREQIREAPGDAWQVKCAAVEGEQQLVLLQQGPELLGIPVDAPDHSPVAIAVRPAEQDDAILSPYACCLNVQ